jgi:hypothetical protein
MPGKACISEPHTPTIRLGNKFLIVREGGVANMESKKNIMIW